MASFLPGAAALLFIILLVGGSFAALVGAAGDFRPSEIVSGAFFWGVVRFTIFQAALSTIISVGLGIGVARALSRRPNFFGRAVLVRLFGLPMVVPVIVGVFGVVAIYGNNGLLNQVLGASNPDWRYNFYGLAGILTAHVFFNLPLAVRLLAQGWETIPGENWRLAAQLGMSSGAIFRLLEWPMLKRHLPGVAGVIFLLCFCSFTAVLVLGGGPGAATIEVAIYQALRFEFNPARAVGFALIQFAICAAIVGVGLGVLGRKPETRGLGMARIRPDGMGFFGRVGDGLWIALAALFVGAPLAAILVAGLGGPVAAVLSDVEVWQATGRSLAVALSAATLASVLGVGLSFTARALRLRLKRKRLGEGLGRGLDLIGSLTLVAPPFVIGTGLFVLLRPVADVFALGLVLVVLINALMTVPFVIAIIGPHLLAAGERTLRLGDSLGMAGFSRFRLADWPVIRAPARLAFALSAALSFGDMGVIALFGTQDTRTLPLLMYHRMGAYRMDEAAVTAVLLLAMALLVFWMIEKGGRIRAIYRA